MEVDAPVSRSELSRGPQELFEHRKARINWSVLLISSAVIIAFSIWAILIPSNARTSMKAAVDWIALSLGWYYVVTMALVIGFVLWVALSKEGSVRLGPDHSRPQYKLVTWVAMLFAAGVGIDMLFYSVTGPVVQYLYPPSGAGESLTARQDAIVDPATGVRERDLAPEVYPAQAEAGLTRDQVLADMAAADRRGELFVDHSSGVRESDLAPEVYS